MWITTSFFFFFAHLCIALSKGSPLRSVFRNHLGVFANLSLLMLHSIFYLLFLGVAQIVQVTTLSHTSKGHDYKMGLSLNIWP